MKNITSIDRVDNIPYKEFVEKYVNTRIPVVFKNASASWWKNENMFTPEFFSEKFGDYATNSAGKIYTVDQILDMTAKSTKENPAPYPTHFDVQETMPELLKDFDPIHMNYSQPNWFRSSFLPYNKMGNAFHLFFGGMGNQYVLHRDIFHTHAWVTQLYGEKKFTVFLGEDHDEYLYSSKDEFYSPINIAYPDYEKYPKFKNARPIEVTLSPGETIYIPSGVWHTTIAYKQNITLIYDQLNSSNYPDWRKDIYHITKNKSKVKAIAYYIWALGVGGVCKLAELFGKKF